MKSLFPFKTESLNTYVLSKSKKLKQTMLVHPDLIPFLYGKQQNTKEEGYYAGKARFLRSNFITEQDSFDGRVSPEQIEKSFYNFNQIVFEVTDKCNLDCKYCGYGRLYGNYDVRETKSLNFKDVKPLFSFLEKLNKRNVNNSIDKITYISFYGGEPLMNMKFIKEAVSYIESFKDENRYVFSMTTNATLLDKHIDFLQQKKFRLLISLDGNKSNNAYRTYKNGRNSFDKIIKNLELVKKKYPKYFEENINFNAVLHNKNSVEDIYNYIYTRYGKTPRIGELNNNGILPEKREEFRKMYNLRTSSLEQSPNKDKIEHKLFTVMPSYYDATNFLHTYNAGVIKSYNSLLTNKKHRYIPTGTCLAFSKKIFITVNGKILPCESIGHQFALGRITKDGVEIDFQKIAEKYNTYYDKLKKQCSKCYKLGDCFQCIFNIESIDSPNPRCDSFTSKTTFSRFLAHSISFFEKKPKDYYKIMNEVILK